MKQPIFWGYASGSISGSGTTYTSVMGNARTNIGDENGAFQIVPISGSFSKLYLSVDSELGVGVSLKATLRVNGVNTSLTATVGGSNLYSADLANEVNVSAGDLVSIEFVKTSLPAGKLFGMGMIFDSGTGGCIFMNCDHIKSFEGSSSDFFASIPSNDVWQEEAEPGFSILSHQDLVPLPGTLKNLRVRSSISPGSPNWTVVVMKNNEETSLKITLNGINKIAIDSSNTVSVSPTDMIGLKWAITGGARPGSFDYFVVSLEFDPATDGLAPLMVHDSRGVGAASDPMYYGFHGHDDASTEAALRYIYSPELITFSNLYVKLSASPGSGKSVKLAFNSAGSDSNLFVTLSDSQTSGNDTIDTQQVQAATIIQMRQTVTNPPVSNLNGAYVHIGMVAQVFVEECDEDLVNKRYRLDYTIDTQRPAQDILNDMLSTFAGFLVYSGSKIKLRCEKAETITQYFGDGSTTDANASFDPNNIVKDSFSWNTSSVDDRPNRMRVQWVDPDQEYVKVYTQVEDRIDQDERGTIINKDVSLLGITRASQASRMAKFLLGSAKYAATTIAFSARLDSIHCEVGDVIAVTHQSARFTRKQFRITSMQEAQDETIRITCKEYNPSLYDDRKGAGIIQMATPTFVNPYGQLDDPTPLTLTEGGFSQPDGTWITTVTATWTALSGDQLLRMAYHEIQVLVGSNWVTVGTAEPSATSFIITVGTGAAGSSLTVRVRAISNKGVASAGSNATQIILTGKKSAPSDVEGFGAVFTVDHVAMTWVAVGDPDLAGYEIRMGETNSSWETADIVVTGYQGTSYDAFNVAPGTKVFYIKALDNTGNSSANAASATVSVGGVPGTVQIFEFDIFSRMTVFPHPLEGTLSSELMKVPTADSNPLYNKTALQPRTATTWGEYQAAGGTWQALQDSSFTWGREEYVTDNQTWETTVIDIGSVVTNGTFIVDRTIFRPGTKTGLIAALLSALLFLTGRFFMEISTSTDGVSYSAYTVFSNGEYTARFVKFRFNLKCLNAEDRIRLAGAKFTVRI